MSNAIDKDSAKMYKDFVREGKGIIKDVQAFTEDCAKFCTENNKKPSLFKRGMQAMHSGLVASGSAAVTAVTVFATASVGSAIGPLGTLAGGGAGLALAGKINRKICGKHIANYGQKKEKLNAKAFLKNSEKYQEGRLTVLNEKNEALCEKIEKFEEKAQQIPNFEFFSENPAEFQKQMRVAKARGFKDAEATMDELSSLFKEDVSGALLETVTEEHQDKLADAMETIAAAKKGKEKEPLQVKEAATFLGKMFKGGIIRGNKAIQEGKSILVAQNIPSKLKTAAKTLETTVQQAAAKRKTANDEKNLPGLH